MPVKITGKKIKRLEKEIEKIKYKLDNPYGKKLNENYEKKKKSFFLISMMKLLVISSKIITRTLMEEDIMKRLLCFAQWHVYLDISAILL